VLEQLSVFFLLQTGRWRDIFHRGDRGKTGSPEETIRRSWSERCREPKAQRIKLRKTLSSSRKGMEKIRGKKRKEEEGKEKI